MVTSPPQSCFCHRTCADGKWVPVIVDSFSAHCDALTLNYLENFDGRTDPTKNTGGMQAGGPNRCTARCCVWRGVGMRWLAF
jgi:hypothetical protein